MRVIAGEFRSRRLKTAPGLEVRPTPDRLRETLFNVLAPRIQDAVFVDAYAGSGAVGIEALSRGASRAIFVERNRGALSVLRENLAALGLAQRAEIVHGKASAALSRVAGDIIFLDPPYDLEAEYSACLDALSMKPPPLIIVQHASRFHLPESHAGLQRFRVLRQGDNSLSFYQPAD